jgi:hypothetical protein
VESNEFNEILKSIAMSKELALFALDIRAICQFNPEALKSGLVHVSLGPYNIRNEDRENIEKDRAAWSMEHLATQHLMVTLDSAFETVFKDDDRLTLNSSSDYFIFIRCLRNAFAHNPFYPKWVLKNPAYQRKMKIVDDWEIDLTNRNNTPVEQEDYRYLSGLLLLADSGVQALKQVN